MKTSSLASILWLGIGHTIAAPVVSASDQAAYQIQWSSCPEGSPAALECGQIQVPLDWNVSNEDQITLGLARIKATDPSKRIGSLLFNPGGPGATATDFCLYQASGVTVFSDALTQHFDIVCPDPRGIGSSTPITCDPDTWNQNMTSFPRTVVELEELIESNKAKGQSCLNMTGPLLQHVDTVSAASDIEAIRRALDDGKLNWLGESYGSQLGYTYAQLYPENIRVMALDGILDHTQPPAATLFTESATYEDSLNRFFQWCATNATACGFEGIDLPRMFDDLVASANGTPLSAPGCAASADTTSAGTCLEAVTGEDIILNVQEFLLFTENLLGLPHDWRGLGTALNQSITENNATLLSSAIYTTNTSIGFSAAAISCLDWARYNISNTTQAFYELQQRQAAAFTSNPHIGSASQTWTIQTQCIGWPAKVVDPQGLLDQDALKKAPGILLVNSKHDPSTSYTWAQSINKQIPGSVLVTRDGDGHTSYFSHGDAAALIDTYLVEGTLPAEGIVVAS